MDDFILVVPGIETDYAPFSWARQAATWFEDNTSAKAEAYQYEVHFFDRFVWQSRHVSNVLRKIQERLDAGKRVSVVAHSNGCDIVCKALALLPRENAHGLEQVHLFCAATDSDFNKNGLNAALTLQHVDKVFVYGSEDDVALKLATLSKTLFGWAGLGYGDLGRTRPSRILPSVRSRVDINWEPGFGHSTWFDPKHFETTLRRVASSLNLS